MKILILALIVLPASVFAQTASQSDANAKPAVQALFGGGSYCGRESDFPCIGHAINSMCAINRQSNLYGNCTAQGDSSDQSAVECRCH